MSTDRGPIGMADALTAARRLGMVDDQQLDRLTDLLGLSRPVEPPAIPPRPRRDPARRSTRSGRTDEPETSADGADAGDGSAGASGWRTVAEPLPMEPVAPIAYAKEDLLSPAAGASSVAYQPIVPLHQLRAAMTRLIQRPRRSLEPDIEAAVELIAERLPLDQLPRLVEQTLDGGITLVADVGPEMVPFLDDVDHLVAAARHVAGEPGTALHWVEESDEVIELTTERPIMIISALGAVRAPGSRPGAGTHWRERVRNLIDAEADLTALVPHRRVRDAAARENARFVTWDDLSKVGRGRG